MSTAATAVAWKANVPPDAKLLLLALANGDDLHVAAMRCGLRSVHAHFLAVGLREHGHLDSDLRFIEPAEPEPPPASSYRKQPIPRALRRRVLARDDYLCVYCGAEENLTIDHVVAEWKGGETVEENLVTACQSCNSSKGTRSSEDWLRRRSLREQAEQGPGAAGRRVT